MASPTAVIIAGLIACQSHATLSIAGVNTAWQLGYERCAQIEPKAHDFLAREERRDELTRPAREKRALAEAIRALKRSE